jgi:hypothetical protein
LLLRELSRRPVRFEVLGVSDTADVSTLTASETDAVRTAAQSLADDVAASARSQLTDSDPDSVVTVTCLWRNADSLKQDLLFPDGTTCSGASSNRLRRLQDASGVSATLQVQTTDSGSADLTEHVGDGSLLQTLEVNGESVTATVGEIERVTVAPTPVPSPEPTPEPTPDPTSAGSSGGVSDEEVEETGGLPIPAIAGGAGGGALLLAIGAVAYLKKGKSATNADESSNVLSVKDPPRNDLESAPARPTQDELWPATSLQASYFHPDDHKIEDVHDHVDGLVDNIFDGFDEEKFDNALKGHF